MKRWLISLSVILAGFAAWAYATPVQALVMMPLPGPARVVNSDAVIVGKVIAIEPQDVQVMQLTYRIAVVQVGESLRGAKDAKTVRVGFNPPPVNVKPPLIGKFRNVQLQVGQEGMFLLSKHQKENFYVLGGPMGYFISSENNTGFDKELKAVKLIVKLGEDPVAGLKSKDAEERFMSAAVLLEKYRTFRGPGKAVLEPVDAAESKMILLALADADWQANAAVSSLRPNPINLFYKIGINQKDGWMPPPGGDQQAAMQTWLRKNADTYRIQRFAAAESK